MAQYDVLYACGHTGTVHLYGPGADRQRKIAYLKGVDCPRCARDQARPQIDVWMGRWGYVDARCPPRNRPSTPPYLARIVVDITNGHNIREHLKYRRYKFVRDPMDGRGMPQTLGLLATREAAPIWRKQWGFSDAPGARRAVHDIAIEVLDLRRIASIPRADLHYQTRLGLHLQILLGHMPDREA